MLDKKSLQRRAGFIKERGMCYSDHSPVVLNIDGGCPVCAANETEKLRDLRTAIVAVRDDQAHGRE